MYMRAWSGVHGTIRVEVKARFGLILSGLLMFDLGLNWGRFMDFEGF